MDVDTGEWKELLFLEQITHPHHRGAFYLLGIMQGTVVWLYSVRQSQLQCCLITFGCWEVGLWKKPFKLLHIPIWIIASWCLKLMPLVFLWSPLRFWLLEWTSNLLWALEGTKVISIKLKSSTSNPCNPTLAALSLILPGKPANTTMFRKKRLLFAFWLKYQSASTKSSLSFNVNFTGNSRKFWYLQTKDPIHTAWCKIYECIRLPQEAVEFLLTFKTKAISTELQAAQHSKRRPLGWKMLLNIVLLILLMQLASHHKW